MSYHQTIVSELDPYIIPHIAIIIADYVTPVDPTDKEIGIYDIQPLIDSVKDKYEYAIGLGFGGHLDRIPKDLYSDGLEGACEKGDMKSIQQLLKMSVNTTNGLRGACRGNQTNIALMMLARGANPRESGHIEEACNHDNLDLVQILVKKGAPPDGGIENACKHNYREIIDYLISNGANLNLALIGAVKGQHINLISEFLDKGTHPWWVTQLAAMTKNKEIISLIRDGILELIEDELREIESA